MLDGFDRAFQHAEKNQSSLFEGLQAIHRKLLGVLQAQGIAPFDSVGQAFNPELHEAIAAVAASTYANQPVVLSTPTSDPTTGDGTLRVIVEYVIVTL